MRKQLRKVGIHLLKRGQQALAPLAVQTGNTTAKCLDRFLKVRLFTDQVVMLDLHLKRIFFGAQIHGPQCIALAFQRIHTCF